MQLTLSLLAHQFSVPGFIRLGGGVVAQSHPERGRGPLLFESTENGSRRANLPIVDEALAR
jgi:hypothetical protein